MKIRTRLRTCTTMSLVFIMPISTICGCASTSHLNDHPENFAIVNDTQKLKETVVIRVLPRASSAEAHAVPAVLAAVFVAKIAVRLVQKLFQSEARKYEATAKACTTFYMTALSPANSPIQPVSLLSARADIIFARVVEDPKEVTKLPKLNDACINTLADDAVAKITGNDKPSAQDIRAVLNDVKGDGTRVLTFLAIGRLAPRPGNESFEIQLLSYTYSALKAKSESGSVFGNLEKRDDQFILALTGPSGLPASVGNFGVAHSFPVSPQSPPKSGQYEFHTFDNIPRGEPIAVPSFRDMVLTGSLTETSNFKEWLERLAEEAGKLDPSGWFDFIK